ncbi:MAG: glycosyltransferase family 4 protein [Proteobacteria bacterium]|nr:glycosyltransferase family 4 protein [Pseudomonadota bacterium]MBU1545468.1 glycosyltransferase family 4 protein [Pseudomonadota bacterium]
MKILLANKFFHLNGGSERVFFQERQFLLENGVSVVDFSMQDARNVPSPFAEYFIDKIDYAAVKGVGGKLKTARAFIHSAEAVRKIEQLIDKERPDIAHLHNIYHQLTPSIIPVLKKHGVKVVVTLHDYKLICPSYIALDKGEICTACDGAAFWRPLSRHCQDSRLQEILLMAEGFWHRWRRSYEAVDLFLAPSRFLADLTSRRIQREKIAVLPNGIDLQEYTPDYDDTGYGLYFGRLSKEKGIETLLEAHSSLGSSLPLKVVGTGPLSDRLARDFPAAEFLGYKSGEELTTLIREAAFVVAPSEWYENCSMVVLESMALGKPVIGSNIGGIPEQIEDGGTGFLFPMGDTAALAARMGDLARNKDLRISMGRAARRKLENEFSLLRHCENLQQIYQGLLT